MIDFYEDDEPVDKIRRLFDTGDKTYTTRPTWTITPSTDRLVIRRCRLEP